MVFALGKDLQHLSALKIWFTAKHEQEKTQIYDWLEINSSHEVNCRERNFK